MNLIPSRDIPQELEKVRLEEMQAAVWNHFSASEKVGETLLDSEFVNPDIFGGKIRNKHQVTLHRGSGPIRFWADDPDRGDFEREQAGIVAGHDKDGVSPWMSISMDSRALDDLPGSRERVGSFKGLQIIYGI